MKSPLEKAVKVGVKETLGDVEVVMEGVTDELMVPLLKKEGDMEGLELIDIVLVTETVEEREGVSVEVREVVVVPQTVARNVGLEVELGQVVMVEDTVMCEAVRKDVTLAEVLIDGDTEMDIETVVAEEGVNRKGEELEKGDTVAVNVSNPEEVEEVVVDGNAVVVLEVNGEGVLVDEEQ